jgi:hypothetical protein
MMFRHARITWVGMTLVLVSAMSNLFGAVPVPLEFQQSREEDRIRQIQLDAEASLREKIEVGKQRYEERQAFRQAVLEGMQSQADERRDEIARKTPLSPQSVNEEPFDITDVTLVLMAVVGVFFAAKHVRKLEFEELSLGSPQIEVQKVAPPPVAPEEPVEKEEEWRQTIRTMKLPANFTLEAQQDTTFLCKGDVERRLQPLAQFAEDLGSVRICLDVSGSVGESVPEEAIRTQMENCLAAAGIGVDEESKICLALAVFGVWDPNKTVFQHREKAVVIETATLFKQNSKAAERRALWGAEYSGRAALPELENDLLAVVQVFVELFANDRLTVRSHHEQVA